MANVKNVRIVVAAIDDLRARCANGEFLPTDILVDADAANNVPFQCPNGELVAHDAGLHDHFPASLLELSHFNKESVRWYSDVDFKIHKITLTGSTHGGKVPTNPFPYLDIRQPAARELHSGRISTAAINHQYKIHLKIGDRLIDPDVWCGF